MIDSHCHFDFAAFEKEQANIWQRCQNLGIKKLIIPGTEPAQWFNAEKLTTQLPGVYSSCGLHPWWIQNNPAAPLTHLLQDFIEKHQPIAIGECGMDKHIAIDEQQQSDIFAEHLRIACEFDLPIIVHVRDSHNAVIRLLKQYKTKRGGVIHAFSGSLEIAIAYWQLGFYLGVGGVITYPRAQKTRATLKAMPLEALLLETDAPDMPLYGKQGEHNSPEYLPLVAQALAQLRNEPLDKIVSQTTLNCEKLFFRHGL